MLETSARLLRLLSLLQSRRDWTGAELADRLGVGLRTVRRDIDRLRDLGYPVDATPGVAGGYRLGVGRRRCRRCCWTTRRRWPWRSACTRRPRAAWPGSRRASLRALTKLQQMLPSRLRHRVSALHATTVPLTGPAPRTRRTPSCSPPSRRPAGTSGGCGFDYPGRDGVRVRDVEPHRLVHTPRRWYLLAWDIGRGDWRTFRVDRIAAPAGTARRPVHPAPAARR